MKYSFECTVFFTWLLTICAGDNPKPTCKFPGKTVVPKAFEKLKGLVGHRFTVPYENNLVYNIGICTDAVDASYLDKKAGVLQFDKSKKDAEPTIIGKYELSSVMGGTNWALLQYDNGDNYDKECGLEPRKAMILFTCDPDASFDSPGMRMIEEENEKHSGCYYLFEMPHPSVCDVQTSKGSSLSIGSIILIVFFCVVAVYLIAGGLYQRFIMGAKGTEQIPNYDFWKDFGNLQADGCNFVCRTHDARNLSPYKGLGDDQLDEPEERDDNLLPM